MYTVDKVYNSELRDHFGLTHLVKGEDGDAIALCVSEFHANFITEALNNNRIDSKKMTLILNCITLALGGKNIHHEDFIEEVSTFSRDLGVGILEISNVVNLLRIIASHE